MIAAALAAALAVAAAPPPERPPREAPEEEPRVEPDETRPAPPADRSREAPPEEPAPPPEAAATRPPPPPEPDEPPRRWVSATLGLPAHLLFTGVELKGEFRVQDHVGLAAYGGLGTALAVNYGQLGGQVRWYAAGDFQHGLALGADLNLLSVDRGLSLVGFDVFDARGSALGVGAFLGYKLVTRPGFTFGVDAGLRRHAISYEAAERVSGDDRGSARDATLWWPLADLHLGWSF